MSEMVSVASGFQYSVNIEYDLNNNEKLQNFIPTTSSLDLLEDILLSTNPTSTDRARILIGAYGKGKSQIVLAILAMLMKKDLKLFQRAMPKIKENKRLYQLLINYYESDNKILPVIITGSSASLSQSFLLALQQTLSMYGLDVMPETNYKAAVQIILRWEKEFPETYEKLQDLIDIPITKFINELQNYNTATYEEFAKIYPTLTAGSVFNPFIGFDVVELYEEVVKSLKSFGYTGIYIIYDEFSKYLESNINDASRGDTKMLQDFAEKCNRSKNQQLHLMLISHKEITNYIGDLSKQKVLGWRGVSERFKHVYLNNNFTQTYEIIQSVIQKKEPFWTNFCNQYNTNFIELIQNYKNHNIFSDEEDGQAEQTIYGCYPLHPVSTFILPRLSEKIAQNERTLFTFLSAPGTCTLRAFLDEYKDDHFEVITPDLIYDYFETLFKKEAYDEGIHDIYILAEKIIDKLNSDSLESKIVKTLALIYMLGQFEKLQPSKAELLGIYSNSYTLDEINLAIDNLIEKEYVIYLKHSNGFLCLKQSSGINIQQKINDTEELIKKRITIKDTLNESNFDNYMYPSRYNNERDMIRYFSFEFIDENEVTYDVDWNLKSNEIEADGVIFGILPQSETSIKQLKEIILATTGNCNRCIFVLPKHYTNIADEVKEFEAVTQLRDESNDDKVLFDEYEVIYEDLREVIETFISEYTHPEEYKSMYFFAGREVKINRKAALTELMSNICDQVYSLTPVINNESLNRNELTSTANNSRKKIIAALLRNELEPNLGLTGLGQEVSIMRSTLIRTGVLEEEEGILKVNLSPSKSKYMDVVLGEIQEFIVKARNDGPLPFDILYDRLINPSYHIGLRGGLIPIYLAAVIHEYKREIIICDQYGQVPVSADTLLQINARPDIFTLSYLDWDSSKEEFVNRLSKCFADYVVEAEKDSNSYDYVISAMRRWYMALPKYTKECKKGPNGKDLKKGYIEMLRLLKQNMSGKDLLFDKLPKAFGFDGFTLELVDYINEAKVFFDEYLFEVKRVLCNEVKSVFALPQDRGNIQRMSMWSVINDWCESLSPMVFDQLFTDGTDKCLKLFRTLTNDDDTMISRLAKLATDLRIEDWNDEVRCLFGKNIERYKETAESYNTSQANNTNEKSAAYQLTYTDDSGNDVTKRFNRVDTTKRGELLYNQVETAIESMGQSISDQEKRQVLMEVLKKLCS